jgi:hypothetical protein
MNSDFTDHLPSPLRQYCRLVIAARQTRLDDPSTPDESNRDAALAPLDHVIAQLQEIRTLLTVLQADLAAWKDTR